MRNSNLHGPGALWAPLMRRCAAAPLRRCAAAALCARCVSNACLPAAPSLRSHSTKRARTKSHHANCSGAGSSRQQLLDTSVQATQLQGGRAARVRGGRPLVHVRVRGGARGRQGGAPGLLQRWAGASVGVWLQQHAADYLGLVLHTPILTSPRSVEYTLSRGSPEVLSKQRAASSGQKAAGRGGRRHLGGCGGRARSGRLQAGRAGGALAPTVEGGAAPSARASLCQQRQQRHASQ